MNDTFLVWVLGCIIASNGFLLVRVIQLSVDMKDRAPFKWIEETFSSRIEKKIEDRHSENREIFSQMTDELKEIKGALIGTVANAGVLPRLKYQDAIIERIEAQMKKLCDGCKYYKDQDKKHD